jgi:hypothetical protein
MDQLIQRQKLRILGLRQISGLAMIQFRELGTGRQSGRKSKAKDHAHMPVMPQRSLSYKMVSHIIGGLI